MIGLAPHTGKIIDAVAQLDCIRSYWLVGGTALSLQLHTRQSEDLDFQKWRTSKDEKMEVAWDVIEKELSTIGEIERRDTCAIVSRVRTFCRCLREANCLRKMPISIC